MDNYIITKGFQSLHALGKVFCFSVFIFCILISCRDDNKSIIDTAKMFSKKDSIEAETRRDETIEKLDSQLYSDVMKKLYNEIVDKKNSKRKLSEELIVETSMLTKKLKPYITSRDTSFKYLLSPEKGEILKVIAKCYIPVLVNIPADNKLQIPMPGSKNTPPQSSETKTPKQSP